MQLHSFFNARSYWSMMGLSNEVLCILVAQGAAKLPEVKIGDTRKNLVDESLPNSSVADWAK